MSLQETNLQAIADAIRQKDGTTAPIPASAFAARILDIQTGSDFAIPLIVTVDPGAAVTAVNGDISVTGTAGEDGTLMLTLTAPGVWTVTGTLVDVEKSTTVEVVEGYEVKLTLTSRLPEGYTEVEYIYSDNHCGFNTEFKVNFSDCRFVLDMEAEAYLSSVEFILSANSLGSGNAARRFQLSRSTDTTLYYWYNNYEQTTFTAQITNQRLVIDWNFLEGYLKVGALNRSISRASYTLQNPVYFMTLNNTTPSVQAKIYSFKIYQNDVLQRDYVPCVKSDGTPGLFDLVEEKFCKNAWEGSFMPRNATRTSI